MSSPRHSRAILRPSRFSQSVGASLPEALVAMAIVVIVAAGVGHLFLWGRRAVWSAGTKSIAIMLASQKVASLQMLLWEVDPAGAPISDEATDLSTEPPNSNGMGLRPSPGASLISNTPGYVDYLDADGRWRGTGVHPPAGAAFVRRWSIEPFASDPANTLVFTVVVAPLIDASATSRTWERAVRLTTIRTRVVRSSAASEPPERSGNGGVPASEGVGGTGAATPPGEGNDTRGALSKWSRLRPVSGFSLIEVLVATAITLIVIALACALAIGAQAMWRVDNARVDLQQRSRVAADTLTRILLAAGAGPNTGSAKGSLLRALAPLVPRRVGLRKADPANAFRSDAISVLHAVAEAEHTTLSLPAAPGSTTLDIASTSCALPACGFTAGSSVVLHDGSGNYDVFTVSDVQNATLTVRHHGAGSVASYPAGSPVVHVEARSIYLDLAARVLRTYDGDASDLPLLDDVVGMQVEYLGDVRPPAWPKPAAGQANCLYESDGAFRAALMPVLSGPAASAVLGESNLTDGPWCGMGGNQFDADLLRVRRVRVMLRLQASDPAVRGDNPRQFHEPGIARAGGGMVPDAMIVIDVTPPNLRQAW